jgi:hypothetical protein
MTRSLRTVCLVVSMLCALGAWAGPTTIIYTGPTDVVFGRDTFLRAIAFSTSTGQPLFRRDDHVHSRCEDRRRDD